MLEMKNLKASFLCAIESSEELSERLGLLVQKCEEYWSPSKFTLTVLPHRQGRVHSTLDSLTEYLQGLSIYLVAGLRFTISGRTEPQGEESWKGKATRTALLYLEWQENGMVKVSAIQAELSGVAQDQKHAVEQCKQRLLLTPIEKLYSSMVDSFPPVTPSSAFGLFSDQQEQILQVHQAGLLHLSKVSKNLVLSLDKSLKRIEEERDKERDWYNQREMEKLLDHDSRYQEKVRLLEQQHEHRQQQQTKEIEKYRNEVEEALSSRKEALDVREAALDEREKTMDLATSRDARRKIREELKKELKKRALRFDITRQSSWIYWTVNVFALVLLGALTYVGAQILWAGLDGDGSVHWSVFVRQLLVSGALGAVVFVVVKWNQSWFLQRVKEEFRLKRLDLDIDRASWVVEMAMEWAAERDTEIPAGLLETLSRGVFEEGGPRDEHRDDTLLAYQDLLHAKLAADLKNMKGELDNRPIGSPQQTTGDKGPRT